MKRFFLCLFCLLLLLCGCEKKPAKFKLDEDGFGVTAAKGGRHYVALDATFEPKSTGNCVGEAPRKNRDALPLYEIPGLSADVFLADDEKTVYFAGQIQPDAANWQLSAVLVCEEDVIAVEKKRLSPGENDAEIALLQQLWFGDAEPAALPIVGDATVRRIKLCCDEYPNLLYCFEAIQYDSGDTYFFERLSRKTVAVPQNLAALLF